MKVLPDGCHMQQADRYTIQEEGIPSLILMEHAAMACVDVLGEENIDCEHALIVCGSGNNGGDGFAIARLLHKQGKQVTVLFAGRESSLSEECRCQKEIVECLGIEIVTEFPTEEYTVIIDAIFGVGLSREITGHYAEVIEWINQSSVECVAIDIPSGISSSTGQVLGCAVRSVLTIAIQCEKFGTVVFPGKNYAGKVITKDIGITTDFLIDDPEVPYTLEKSELYQFLPERCANSHKGTYGKVLMITGSHGMAGAAFLSAKAAYTTGAGLVRIYTEESNRIVLQQLLPEAIITTYEDYDQVQLSECLQWADIVCTGCGFGTESISEKIMGQILETCNVPCVIDADGLNLIAKNKWHERLKDRPFILTPHLKEMSRLLEKEVGEIQKNAMKFLTDFVKNYNIVCALKDSRTFVAQKDRSVFVNTAGNQAMAKAGAGDVLAGTITGLLAGGLMPFEAARAGVFLHACSGDWCREYLGSYSVLAQDLIKGIQECLKKAEEQSNETV